MQVQKARKGYKLVKSLFGKYEEIPEEWDFKRLDKIGEIVGGGTPDSTNNEYWNGKILWVVPTDITKLKSNFIDNSERKISEKGLKESSAKLLPIGSILITSRATIGECAITTKPIATNQGFQSLICNKQNDNLFWFYAIKLHKKRFLRLSYGTTFLEISKNAIKKVSIPTTISKKEQQKIASILSNVDSLIQQTQKEIELNNKLKKGLMQRLLTKGIGHTKFKESSLKVRFLKLTIPENWKVDSLIHICKIIDTPHYTSPLFDDELIPVITTANCDPNGQIDYSKVNFTSKEEYLKRSKVIDPEIGDLLFTREAPLGIAAFVDKKEISVGQRIILLKINKEVMTSKFLVFFLNSEIGRLQSNSLAIKTTVERVNISDIKQFKIPIPPLAEQERIVSILSNIDSQIQRQQEYKSHLETLKKGLMQKLLTGKIRVKV